MTPEPPPPSLPEMGPLRRLASKLRSPADRVSALRLAMIPPLWCVAAMGRPVLLGFGVLAAAATDVLDGHLARRARRTTELGSRLDSIADHLLSASLLAWLAWLRPAFFRQHALLLAAWAGLAALTLAVAWIRFGRPGDLHLYSAKAAGTLAYLFGIGLLVFGTHSPALFYLVIGVALAAAAETLAALLILPRVDERIGSLLLRRRAG